MPFYAGKDASFTFNSVSNYCSKWDFDVTRSEIDVTYMTGGSSKWRRFISGFNNGKITAEGPHDPTVALPWNAEVVTFSLLIGSTYTITGNAAVTRVGVGTDIEGAARWRIEGRVDGAPTIA